ncbi:EAL domain-containing protein [Dactylosporangium sp. NPDC000244]|uniref:EAL domain-containing protein n=1 Tax=Dactylosporangium sp. NPDC000244 TaxID=3154365 RepID=UPI00332DBB30
MSVPAPAPLRPSSFRSRVSRTLASRNVLRARLGPAATAAPTIGLEDDTVEVTPLGMLETPVVTRTSVLELAGLQQVLDTDTDTDTDTVAPSADAAGDAERTADPAGGPGARWWSRGGTVGGAPWLASRGGAADGVVDWAVRDGAWTIERVLAERAVTPLFQPIVELAGLRPIGVEALSRGPAGSGLWRARDLFAAAVAAGRLAELDALCAERALETARAADAPPPLVFVNAEPAVINQPLSARVRELMTDAPFRMVLEYTERALSAHPAALLQLAATVQAHGHCLALDDVGADPMSLAFLPLLEPEVVKLDLQLLRAPHAPRTVEVVAAVNAVAEQTGALIVAEGIETPQDLANARALGAHWGQGLLFGEPAPLPEHAGRFVPAPRLRKSRPDVHLPAGTPFEAAAARGKTRAATPDAFAARLDHVLRRAGNGAVVLATCTDADTARSWLPSLTGLAERAAFVGLVAPLHPAAVGPGVRFAQGPGAAVEECALIVVAPRYTAAVCGRGSHSAMEFAHTEDGALVAEMARIVLQQLPR